MKNSNSKLVDRRIIGTLAALFGALGLAIAYSQFMVYELPWQTHRLLDPPRGAMRILKVELNSFADDPTGDRVFIETNDGLIYSYRLFEDSWLGVDEVPDSDFQLSESCAPEWPGAQSDSAIWDPPPVEKEVRDSAGKRIEHAIAIFVRCYVLSEDGSLELWILEDSALGIIGFMQCAPAYTLIGGLLGLIIGALVVLIRRRRQSPPASIACTPSSHRSAGRTAGRRGVFGFEKLFLASGLYSAQAESTLRPSAGTPEGGLRKPLGYPSLK